MVGALEVVMVVHAPAGELGVWRQSRSRREDYAAGDPHGLGTGENIVDGREHGRNGVVGASPGQGRCGGSVVGQFGHFHLLSRLESAHLSISRYRK